MLKVRWLGINGLEFQYSGKTILADPCVTRGDSALLSDPSLVEEYIGKADAIVMGHSHWDHLVDVPAIIRKTGAAFYGSETSLNILRYFQIPETHLHHATYGTHVQFTDDISFDFYKSIHKQPCEETYYDRVPEKIESRKDFYLGDVFAIMMHFGDMTVLNIGSANLVPEAVHGLSCDYLICGVSRYNPPFPKLVADNLDFKCFIPVHHDNFGNCSLKNFALRDCFTKFKAEFLPLKPEANFMELPVLKEVELGL